MQSPTKRGPRSEYTDAVFDEATGQWILGGRGCRDTGFTAFASGQEIGPGAGPADRATYPRPQPPSGPGPDTIFTTWRFHAFFTTTDREVANTVAADKTHRHHAIIEQVHADLKNSALAHLPSGKFTANAAWLVLAVMAFNLTRAAACTAASGLAKATTATIRRKLIHVPARVASSARRAHPAPTRGLALAAAPGHDCSPAACGPPPALAT